MRHAPLIVLAAVVASGTRAAAEPSEMTTLPFLQIPGTIDRGAFPARYLQVGGTLERQRITGIPSAAQDGGALSLVRYDGAAWAAGGLRCGRWGLHLGLEGHGGGGATPDALLLYPLGYGWRGQVGGSVRVWDWLAVRLQGGFSQGIELSVANLVARFASRSVENGMEAAGRTQARTRAGNGSLLIQVSGLERDRLHVQLVGGLEYLREHKRDGDFQDMSLWQGRFAVPFRAGRVDSLVLEVAPVLEVGKLSMARATWLARFTFQGGFWLATDVQSRIGAVVGVAWDRGIIIDENRRSPSPISFQGRILVERWWR